MSEPRKIVCDGNTGTCPVVDELLNLARKVVIVPHSRSGQPEPTLPFVSTS